MEVAAPVPTKLLQCARCMRMPYKEGRFPCRTNNLLSTKLSFTFVDTSLFFLLWSAACTPRLTWIYIAGLKRREL
jgi:hypothetical protein